VRATKPTPQPDRVATAIQRQLADQGGGSWTGWATATKPFHDAVRQRLRATPAKVKALAGSDGYLFFRNELDYVVGGDLEKQRAGKNPLPVIVEFRNALAARGVDFLFVPVPNKVEVFPERFDARSAALAGRIVAPWGRKLLLSLAAAGVEAVDLWPPFLASRDGLFQAQDTHWTARGLELAAHLVAERIRQYPWYADVQKQARRYTTRDAAFTRHGDLHSRLPEAQKAHYKPEGLVGHQVLNPDGTPYDDDPASPIVVLGDSFTGVYQLMDCEHAGVSAHIAREIGFPVDLVMSYGGGPNVRTKLLRRGVDDLARKRLVIWMMTARDLHDYWEDWQPLPPDARK
jgi:alginate O-acetyltransferase complex protein AlgJ